MMKTSEYTEKIYLINFSNGVINIIKEDIDELAIYKGMECQNEIFVAEEQLIFETINNVYMLLISPETAINVLEALIDRIMKTL